MERVLLGMIWERATTDENYSLVISDRGTTGACFIVKASTGN